MDEEVQKTLLFNKLDKLEELDRRNADVHKKYNAAIMKLLNAKNSNSGLKYLDPEFFLEQAAATIVTEDFGKLSTHDNTKERFTAYSKKDEVEVLNKPFKYIDTYTKDVTLMNKLQTVFKEVLEEYIEHANYINSIRAKKHK